MVTLAFYKARKGNWLDFALNAFGGFGGFAHVELQFSDGWSFSSTSRDDLGKGEASGVRFKKIDYKPDRWEFVPLREVDEDTEISMRGHAVCLVGAPYDFAACVRYVLPFWQQHPEAFMCSEVVSTVMLAAGVLRTDIPPHKISPNRLYKLLGGR